MKGSSPFCVGIDLGTTNTCAAFADGRIPRVIPTERGHNLLASVVAFVDGKTLIGQPAKDQLLINPAETVYGSKRLIGRAYHSREVQQLKERFAYHIVEGTRGRCAVQIGDDVHQLTDIAAILLRQIATYAETHKGQTVDGVVITVPAFYPQSQREAVRQAGKRAGLDVWRLVNEPTAAALTYGLGRHEDQKILVFDLGGGTFDVSIVETAGTMFQVLATGGDGFLGGVDFDIRITEYLLDKFEKDTGVVVRDDSTVVQRILNAAEVAKCDLSALQHTEVRLPFVAQKRGRPLDLTERIDRKFLVELTDDLVTRCMTEVEAALSRAGLAEDDIDEVVLAGGQTRMPAIQDKLHQLFGRPPRRGVHPDEVVAQGAALLAKSLGQSDGIRLLDVISVPIGAAVRKTDDDTPAVKYVIESNIPLPLDASIEIPTTQDNQTEMEIDIFQGFSTDVTEAEYIGSVLYDGLPLGPAGARAVVLTFSVDVGGILSIKAHHGNDRAARRLPLVGRHPDYLESLVWQRMDEDTQEFKKPEISLLRRLFGKG